MERFTVEWSLEANYEFQGVRMNKKDFKSVWYGRFIDRAPAGLSCSQNYCLKQITLNLTEYQDRKKIPSCREYYDLFDFQGEHLRQILAKNPSAAEAEKDLRGTGTIQKSYPPCFVVEPAYGSTKEWFQKCYTRTVEERLGMIAQYAMGCLELRREENKVNGCRVDAHRDLKPENGVLDMVDGTPRVRLVDVASIHLEREATRKRSLWSGASDETFGGPMSRQNTAPEDLRFTNWEVGPTTDVYALGMMLANMFMTDGNGEYLNPNWTWIDKFWPQQQGEREGKDQLIANEFRRCQKAYDNTAFQTTSWIEQALNQRGVVLKWEDLPDNEVLRSIRTLFIQATRIDPKQRITLEEYLEELDRIIELSRKSSKKLPVSLYLFEQTDFNRYASAYQRAARRVFREEQELARREGKPVPRALCVKYHRRLSGQTLSQSMPEVQDRPCVSGRELEEYVGSIPQTNGTGADMTIYALVQGCLLEPNSGFCFSGNVHLFAWEIPEESRMEHVWINGVECDLNRICNEINLAWETQVSIEAHTILGRNENDEEPEWCSHSRIQMEVLRQPVRPPEQEFPCAGRNGRHEDLYVLLPDGTKFML